MKDYNSLDPVVKDPAESKIVQLDFFGWAANFWQPNEQYATNEYVRPNESVSTGFAYQASSGTSGRREPRWPTTIGATVIDGSITWTCATAGTNGLNAVSAPTAVSDPVGITISSVSVSETSKILATYAGGNNGQDYDAVFSFTLNGVPRVARQTVKVRNR